VAFSTFEEVCRFEAHLKILASIKFVVSLKVVEYLKFVVVLVYCLDLLGIRLVQLGLVLPTLRSVPT
jgi:hypothetical protein